tara:strand:+ start:115 stop:342 length:228 start_codon:yes stop_codon:yes gene_type:complete
MKKILSCGDLECLVEQISNVLDECPLYYLIEVLEMAKSNRDRSGEKDDLDVSSDEEEYSSSSSSDDEEDKSSGSD